MLSKRTAALRTSLGLLLVALLLSGCSFHLRGTAELPPLLASICLKEEGLQHVAMAEIRRSLIRQGVVLLKTCPADGAVLAIRGVASDRRVLSVGRSGRVLEYELIETLSFELKRRGGKVLVPLQRIEVRRDFLFDETDVLGKFNEEADLQRRMWQDLVAELLRRIRAAQ